MGLFTRKKSTKPVELKPEPTEPTKPSMKDLYSSPVTAKTATVKAGDKKTVRFGQAFNVIVKPLVTEKVGDLGKHNKYVFQVSARANKVSVAKAINAIYGIKPIKVNIMNLSGKKAGYGRISGRRKDWKKAVVTLPTGQTIKVYEGV